MSSTSSTRKRIAGHVDDCEICGETSRRWAVLPLFSAAPALAAPLWSARPRARQHRRRRRGVVDGYRVRQRERIPASAPTARPLAVAGRGGDRTARDARRHVAGDRRRRRHTARVGEHPRQRADGIDGARRAGDDHAAQHDLGLDDDVGPDLDVQLELVVDQQLEHIHHVDLVVHVELELVEHVPASDHDQHHRSHGAAATTSGAGRATGALSRHDRPRRQPRQRLDRPRQRRRAAARLVDRRHGDAVHLVDHRRHAPAGRHVRGSARHRPHRPPGR